MRVGVYRGYIKADTATHLAIPTHVTCTSQNPTHCIESDTETRFFTKPNTFMSGFQEYRHVRFRSGSTWFNDLSWCDKPLCLPPPSSATRDADTPTQHLSMVQPRVGAPEAARPPLSLGKHEMPKTARKLLGCETVGTTRHYSQVMFIRAAPARNPAGCSGRIWRAQCTAEIDAATSHAMSVVLLGGLQETTRGDPITTRIASSRTKTCCVWGYAVGGGLDDIL
ncbi:hypothetical protein K438DRAFT_1762552 [Mycena galopus ATCC 62051]|nr:hypothetical protein K438DRAFT_1762552 [Mycena galopus ATCC 62051]